MASLQEEKAAADLAAGQWQDQFEAAQGRADSAIARIDELEGQLQAKSDEADKLHLSTKQQRQVISRINTLKMLLFDPAAGFSIVSHFVVHAQAMSCLAAAVVTALLH